MSILLVPFSTKAFRDGAMDEGGTNFAWDRYLGGFGFLFHSAVQGCFIGLIF